MSKVKITGNASGTGTLTIAAPNTNSDRTLDIPDAAGDLVVAEGGTFKIDSSGNVGIGTSSPNHALTIEGVANNGGIRVSNPSGQNNCSLMLTSTGTNNGFRINYNTTNDALIWNTTTGDGTLVDERMRIDSSGNLLVGKTSLAPTTTAGHEFRASGQQFSTIAGTPVILNRLTTDGSIATFQKDGATVGSISVTGSATSYNTSSDYRLKTDVQPMTGATDRLKALKPVNFEWISSGERVDGFLAHELQEVVPEAATGTKDAMRTEEYEVTPAVLDDDGNVVTEAVMGTREVPDYQGIDQSKLVPLLVATIQEQQAAIEALTARVDALEAV